MKVMGVITMSVEKYFPTAAAESRNTFVAAFFAYILGLYPMSHESQKQLEAIKLAGIDYIVPDFPSMCYHGILLLLSEL
jgi:hypothetical protein